MIGRMLLETTTTPEVWVAVFAAITAAYCIDVLMDALSPHRKRS